MRIAVWSGPRNLSTALLYAFGARPDCAALDEPFYAAYLAATGIDHPMRDAVLASQPADPAAVIAGFDPAQGDRPHLYLKLMTHHMIPSVPRGWIGGCANVHLIRHPARVVASYAAKREEPGPADLGFREQAEIFAAFGGIVIDAGDILADPPRMLARLCAALGLPFDPAMLAWPAGPKPFDGAWAPHWYGAVHRSTGFGPPEGPLPALTGRLAALAAAGMETYAALRSRALPFP